MSAERVPYGGAIVYFLIEDVPGGFVKIGTTTDWTKNRISALQTGNARPLRELCYVKGGKETEAQLHRDFARHHVRGEWFRPDPEILLFIIEALRGVQRGAATLAARRQMARIRRLEDGDLPPGKPLTHEQIAAMKAGANAVLAGLQNTDDPTPFIPRRRT